MRENRDAVLDRYRWATQDPVAQAAVLAEIHRRMRDGREALILREDFAGNGADSVAWVAGGRGRRAVAVDADPATVAHGRARALRLLGKRAERIEWFADDVHAVAPPQTPHADVCSVLNFSIGYLHSRAALLRYLGHTRSALAQGGVLVLNTFGGPDALRPHCDRHAIVPGREKGAAVLGPFDYLWETRHYDAATARIDCRIHFEWNEPAGSRRRIDDAFVYHWRLWSLPELTEALREAGFRRAQIWRHTIRQTREGPRGWLRPVRQLREAPVWVAYVVGIA